MSGARTCMELGTMLISWTKCFDAIERAECFAERGARPKPVSLDKSFQSLTVEEVKKLQRRPAWLLGANLL